MHADPAKTPPQRWWQRLAAAARLAVGVPDYQQFVAHRQAHHPGEAIPSYEEFFRERQAARYRRGSSRCC